MALVLNGNRVAVKLKPQGEQRLASGIYLTGEPPKGVREATVLSVGTEYVSGNFLRTSPFQPGQTVLVDELGGQTVKLDGDEFLIIRNEDVVGTL
jgi:chaperonin GroES